jgi:uncharacterized membrane protein
MSPNYLIGLALILIWTIFWKGSALWIAAKKGDFKWFLAILILNTFGILEIIYLLFIKKMKLNFRTWRFTETNTI